MPRAKSKPQKEDINPDYVRMYFEHQYGRINFHTEQSLNLSNIVITISALIVTFGFNNKSTIGSVLILLLPLIIIMVNLFAVLYIRDSGRWIDSHRLRAKKILEDFMPELLDVDKVIVPHHYKGKVTRRKVQLLIHNMFVLIGVVVLVLFILEIFGVSII